MLYCFPHNIKDRYQVNQLHTELYMCTLKNILLTVFTAKTVSVPMIIQVIHACLILINGTNDARPNGLFRVAHHISVNTVITAIKHIYMGK